MAKLNQFYKGETIKISVKPTGDDEFGINTACTMLVYPDNIDLTDTSETNKARIQEVKYDGSNTSDTTKGYKSGEYIVFPISYTTTQNMPIGDYTIELIYGIDGTERKIIRTNKAFILIDSGAVTKGV